MPVVFVGFETPTSNIKKPHLLRDAVFDVFFNPAGSARLRRLIAFNSRRDFCREVFFFFGNPVADAHADIAGHFDI